MRTRSGCCGLAPCCHSVVSSNVEITRDAKVRSAAVDMRTSVMSSFFYCLVESGISALTLLARYLIEGCAESNRYNPVVLCHVSIFLHHCTCRASSRDVVSVVRCFPGRGEASGVCPTLARRRQIGLRGFLLSRGALMSGHSETVIMLVLCSKVHSGSITGLVISSVS